MNKKTELKLTQRIKKNAEDTLKKLFNEEFLNSMNQKQKVDFLDGCWELMFSLCVQVETLGYSSEIFSYKAWEACMQGKKKNKGSKKPASEMPLDKYGGHYKHSTRKQ